MSLIVNERERRRATRGQPCSVFVSYMGVSALGVCRLDANGFPQKYPQSFFAGKTLPNKINHPRPRASRCLVLNSKSNPGPVFGFEMTNEDSVAYASMA